VDYDTATLKQLFFFDTPTNEGILIKKRFLLNGYSKLDNLFVIINLACFLYLHIIKYNHEKAI